MADSIESGSPWSSNASSNERLNYLKVSLGEYDKGYIIQLLNQHIDKIVELEIQNKQFAVDL
jgi:hypothetical protein